jgi:hypothetical protein
MAFENIEIVEVVDFVSNYIGFEYLDIEMR